MRKYFVLAAAFVCAGSLIASAAYAQTTSIGLRAVPSAASYAPGDLFSVSIFLDVNSLAAGDNYTAARFYLAYVQNPSAGSIPPSSLFAATPALTTFTGAGGSSGFQNTTLANPSSAATQGGTGYVGFSVSENSGATPRTDTGSFLLATATGTIRSDAAAGNYSFAFQDFGSGAARTFVTGKFGPSNDPGLFFPATLGGTPATFAITGASIPEPGTLALLTGTAVFALSGRLRLRRTRNQQAGKTTWENTRY